VALAVEKVGPSDHRGAMEALQITPRYDDQMIIESTPGAPSPQPAGQPASSSAGVHLALSGASPAGVEDVLAFPGGERRSAVEARIQLARTYDWFYVESLEQSACLTAKDPFDCSSICGSVDPRIQ